jgi:hypothetical protein
VHGCSEQTTEIVIPFYTTWIIQVIKLWRMKCVGYVACMRQKRNVHSLLGKPEGRWEDNIKLDVTCTG